MSGTAAPAAFRGFARRVDVACGVTWTVDAHDSGDPPERVPAYQAVLVVDSLTKTDFRIAGHTVHIVVVRTDRYDGDEGPARGTVVATVC